MTYTHRDKQWHQNLQEKIVWADFRPPSYKWETMAELNHAIDSLLEPQHRKKSDRPR